MAAAHPKVEAEAAFSTGAISPDVLQLTAAPAALLVGQAKFALSGFEPVQRHLVLRVQHRAECVTLLLADAVLTGEMRGSCGALLAGGHVSLLCGRSPVVGHSAAIDTFHNETKQWTNSCACVATPVCRHPVEDDSGGTPLDVVGDRSNP